MAKKRIAGVSIRTATLAEKQQIAMRSTDPAYQAQLDAIDYKLGNPLGALRHYVRRVEVGANPDPEIARYIAQCFCVYLNQRPKEKVTLEKAFGLQGRKNSHPVIADRRKKIGAEWRNQLRVYSRELGLSKEGAASLVRENLKTAAKKGLVPSVDSMLRIVRAEAAKPRMQREEQ